MKNKIFRQIDELGRLIIPLDLRKEYGLKPGDTVCFTPCENGFFIHSEACAPTEDLSNQTAKS